MPVEVGGHPSPGFDRGEVFGLLGPDGAGKSTTVGLAVGLIEPDRGSIDVDGAGAPTRAEVRRKIGIAPQALALYEGLTAEENLRFFGTITIQGSVSPVHWAILAIEGAIWRDFTPAQMALPCGVLLAIGVVGFALGTRVFRWTEGQ